MDYDGGSSLLMPTMATTVTVLLRDCLGMRAGAVVLFIDPYYYSGGLVFMEVEVCIIVIYLIKSFGY